MISGSPKDSEYDDEQGKTNVPLVLRDNRPQDFPPDSVWCGFKFTIFSTKSRILLHSHKCRSFYSCFAASLHLHISHHTWVKDKKGLSEIKLVSYIFKIQCVSKCEGLSDIYIVVYIEHLGRDQSNRKESMSLLICKGREGKQLTLKTGNGISLCPRKGREMATTSWWEWKLTAYFLLWDPW